MQIGSLLRSTDYFRRSLVRAGGPCGHKEWLHFCLQTDDLDLLINFSVNDDVDASADRPRECGHVIMLARAGDRWFGDADRYWAHEMDVAGGEVAACMGTCRVALDGEAFRVVAGLRDVPLMAELTLIPEVAPSFSNNIHLVAGQSLSWLAVPRLRAAGVVRCAGRTHRVDGAIAYHDHNWGYFEWGADFAWEWGYTVPAADGCPWSVMFVRLSDRALTSTRTQALTLWRGPEIVRSFRGSDLRVRSEGFLRPRSVFKVPPVMGLLAPGTSCEVPRRLVFTAESDGDKLHIVMEAHSVAQIVIPNDRSARVTIINEVVATTEVHGTIRGECVNYCGRGMFEVLAA